MKTAESAYFLCSVAFILEILHLFSARFPLGIMRGKSGRQTAPAACRPYYTFIGLLFSRREADFLASVAKDNSAVCSFIIKYRVLPFSFRLPSIGHSFIKVFVNFNYDYAVLEIHDSPFKARITGSGVGSGVP